MKSKVLDRPMFKKSMMVAGMAPAEEIDPENVGIMSGFKDMMMDLELPEDDEDENGEEREDTEKMLDRTPDSPEILMNNLRGDMRSVDARVEELADLVGYNAAADTPESVLALLQPVLAAQQAPAMPPMMPPGMPPEMPPGLPPGMGAAPPMPPGAPALPPGGIAGLGAGAPPMPPGQPPLQMAKGGIVQRFSDGSDEEGVTAPGQATYPPELVERAREEITKYLASQPLTVPSLESQVRLREPIYKQLLGTADRGVVQGQMLFDVAQAGLNLAAGVDAEGKPLRGAQSPVSRFAAAFSKVPGQIGARAAELQKDERALRLAAIQAGEKDISTIREQNTKLIESQRKLFSDILKSSNTSMFGKGDWHWNVVNRPGLLANWAAGKTSEAQDTLIDSAINRFEERARPRREQRTDPDTSLPYSVEVPGSPMPPFVQQAIDARKNLLGATGAVVAPPGGRGAAPAAGGAPAPAAAATPTAAPEARTVRPETTPSMAGQPGAALPAAPGGGPGTGATQAGALPSRSLWGTSSLITGPVSRTLGAVSGVPGLGDPFPLITQAQNLASQEVENLVEAFLKSGRAPVAEQERLRNLYSVGPKFWDDPAAYRSRLISIDEEIGREMNKASNEAYNDQLASKDRQNARQFLQAAEKFRSSLGVPVRIYTAEDPVYKTLPAGAEYLWQGTIPMRKGGAQRGR